MWGRFPRRGLRRLRSVALWLLLCSRQGTAKRNAQATPAAQPPASPDSPAPPQFRTVVRPCAHNPFKPTRALAPSSTCAVADQIADPGLVGAVNFLHFKYRINAKANDRPAPIGPLQI